MGRGDLPVTDKWKPIPPNLLGASTNLQSSDAQVQEVFCVPVYLFP